MLVKYLIYSCNLIYNRNALKEYNYVEMNCIRLLGIVMYVYSLEEHITKIRNMETGTTATGLMGIIVSTDFTAGANF